MKQKDINKNVKKNINKVKKEASEFKKFISRGNVMDMAVGVIVGGAFSKIVTSLVNDLLMPLIGIIIGGAKFSSLSIEIQGVKIAYGSFIQSVVDFLIIAFCVFVMIRLLGKIKHKEKEVEKVETKKEEVLLLEEIRDLLKEKDYNEE